MDLLLAPELAKREADHKDVWYFMCSACDMELPEVTRNGAQSKLRPMKIPFFPALPYDMAIAHEKTRQIVAKRLIWRACFGCGGRIWPLPNAP